MLNMRTQESENGSQLPVELWAESFRLLSVFHIKKISMTCRLFYDICLPFLFKSISFSLGSRPGERRSNLSEELSDLKEQMEDFCAIASDARRARLIRRSAFTYLWDLKRYAEGMGTRLTELKDARIVFVDALAHSIPQLSGLREIRLHIGKLDKKILNALNSLPNLDSMCFVNPRFGVHLLQPRLRPRQLAIEKTEDTYYQAVDPYLDKSAELLDIFSVKLMESLKSCVLSYTPRLFRSFTRQGNAAHLISLEIQVLLRDIAVFYSFLEVCPNLASLSVRLARRDSGWQEPQLPHLPLSVIPRLKCLRGSGMIVKEFVPGRPVSDIQLVPEEWSGGGWMDVIEDIIHQIGQSTGNVTNLYIQNISIVPLPFLLISAYLPALRKLSLNLGIYPPQNLYQRLSSFDIERIAAYEDDLQRMGETYNDELARIEETLLVPPYIASEYMDLLERVALKMINLPIGLEVLELKTLMAYIHELPLGLPRPRYPFLPVYWTMFPTFGSLLPAIHMPQPDYSTQLPFEVWRECFLYLSLRDHRSLSKTCRYFYDICLPFLFRSITYSLSFTQPEAYEGLDHIGYKLVAHLTTVVARLKDVARDQRLAPLVRRCKLKFELADPRIKRHFELEVRFIKDMFKATYRYLMQTFVRTIKKFVNLKEIEFQVDRPVEKGVLASICSAFPHLERMTFTNARFKAKSMTPRLKTKVLIIDNESTACGTSDESDWDVAPSINLLDIFSNEGLETLESRTWAYTPPLFKALTKQGKATSLVNLNFLLRVEDLDVLYPFLVTCPNVLSLDMDLDTEHVDPLPPLPRSAIPRLRRLQAPSTIVERFVPGRPVVEVQLVEGILDDVLPKLTESTTGLTELYIQNITPIREAFHLVSAYLPRLRKLCLRLEGRACPGVDGEDPNDYDMESVVAKKEVLDQMGPAYTFVLAENADKILLPTNLHAVYMDFLQWIALKKINLPTSLGVLELRTDPYFNFKSRHPNKEHKLYTLWEAGYLLSVLSIHYPELKEIAVVGWAERGLKGSEVFRFSWLKSEGLGWTFSLSRDREVDNGPDYLLSAVGRSSL
ncbi:hypothetical protein CVT26_012743 [Gymnopilus dilepis]|uniref:F-box domain-containing protein n=1 Tax=Gymnopilus dilepis TaxID=231916 RepID=A0A409WDM5_9AGAR|nr:hypothetical protein CVT26_012743 [Gymnopilus dilepis]